eukprot:jgi/Chrzof1/7370/Cz02g21100.t1
MRAYLVARGYSAAITNAEDANSDKALASITLAVEDHFLPTVYKAASAKAAWDALEALFQQRSVANQLNLTQELNNLTLQPGEAITQLLARARIIWEQLKAAGIDKSEQEVALSVLSGLPADFNTLVTVLQNQSGPLTLGGIQKAVLTEQQRANKVGASTSTAASTKAFYTQNGPNRGRLGDSGTRTSNFNQGNGNTKQQEQRKCYYCGKKGHLKRDCRKKKADEEGRRAAWPQYQGFNNNGMDCSLQHQHQPQLRYLGPRLWSIKTRLQRTQPDAEPATAEPASLHHVRQR